MNPFSTFCSVKTLRKQSVIFFACGNDFSFRRIYPDLCSKQMAEMFPKPGIVIVFA